jgi:molybdopterin/thiamine biosynthesis adenylyltransferase
MQTCLCLGVGGLGSTVASSLCRIGVRKVILVDYDVVDSHNLNRQILYHINDINTSKVQAAKKNLESDHVIDNRTEIVAFEGDARMEWAKIVEFVKQSDVVFNMIDVGDYWDIAVQSLCLKMNVPMIIGGTFQTTLTIDYCAGGDEPCWACMSAVKDEHCIISDKLCVDKIDTYQSISFIPKDEHPIGASTVFVAGTCGYLMVSTWTQSLFNGKPPSRTIFYMSTMEIDKWMLHKEPNCILCKSI